MGVDPGFDRVGWAVGKKTGQKIEVLDFGCIQTSRKDEIFQRYQFIQKALVKIIKQHQPQLCAIEKLFFNQVKTSGIRVAEAKGIMISTIMAHGTDVIELSPQAIKLAATGYGKADKKAMEKMIALQLGIPTTKLIDDTVDALAILLAIPNTT